MIENNKVIINVDSTKKSIDSKIYSSFIEHLGECIHNGLWAYDPVNVSLVNNNPRLIGVRDDLLNVVKELKPTVIRAFGGCYSDVYHWKDAIGPREQRKKVKNKYWGTGIRRFILGLGPVIENQFGTDEFLTFCESVGSEPYLNINYGTGTSQEAADWVEYCNGSETTTYGSLRVKNGRKEPYNVKYWGIANEIFGWWEKGHAKNPEDYGKKYLEFAKKMREKDPSIKLVAVGCGKLGWNQTLLKTIGEEWVDYLSIHRYLPALSIHSQFIHKKHPHSEKCYDALMSSPWILEKDINDAWHDITTTLGESSHVRIAFDEWGVWYRFYDVIKTNYNLLDGLWTALILMKFQINSDKCPMANWAQLINCIGIIQTDLNGLILTPVYLAFKAFVQHAYNYLIEDVKVECNTFKSEKYGHILEKIDSPYISCNATINDEGNRLAIIIVNKHFSDKLRVFLELEGFIPNEKGNLIKLHSNTPFDYNTIQNRNKIQITETEIIGNNSIIELELGAHSLTILKLSKK